MTKNTVIPFSFAGHEVRVIDREGSAWFVAEDVCEILSIKNSRDAISRLDDDEKSNVGKNDIKNAPNRGLSVVNESGLWALVLRSRKAEAKKFRKWITSDVIPTIRKTGAYASPALTAKETGGITKAVITKALDEALNKILPEMIKAKLSNRGQSIVSHYKTSNELLVEHGAVQKGRKALTQKVTYELKKLCERENVLGMKDFSTNTWRFPPEIYIPFFKGEGLYWIKLHNALYKDNQPHLI